MKTAFIVLEGLDGSGSSTQAKLLKQFYKEENHKVVLSPEPTEGEIGKIIRKILKGEIDIGLEGKELEEQMSYLFAADRHYHIHNKDRGVLSLKSQGVTVISTRYYFSSLAYQENKNLVKRLNKDFPEPDLVIYLDAPVELSLERLNNRPLKEIYENRQKLLRVKTHYEEIWKDYEGLFLRIRANEKRNNIHSKIIQFILKYL